MGATSSRRSARRAAIIGATGIKAFLAAVGEHSALKKSFRRCSGKDLSCAEVSANRQGGVGANTSATPTWSKSSLSEFRKAYLECAFNGIESITWANATGSP
jgi:hypothetical protein